MFLGKGGTKTLMQSDFVAVLNEVLNLQTADEQEMAQAHWGAFSVEPVVAPPVGGAAAVAAELAAEVSFQWKNPDFLLKNPDFLLKNVDFVI